MAKEKIYVWYMPDSKHGVIDVYVEDKKSVSLVTNDSEVASLMRDYAAESALKMSKKAELRVYELVDVLETLTPEGEPDKVGYLQ